MSKILIVSDKSDLTCSIKNMLNSVGYEVKTVDTEKEAVNITSDFLPDIALVNTACEGMDVSAVCKKLKLQGQTNDIQIILLISGQTASEVLTIGADGYITSPFNDNILIATVNAHLRIKKLLDILYTNNSELARSLYQLNVLYNTSSQLAGTLDKAKLIDIMNEGLEKSLSYSLCSTLVINDPENATLIIKSLHPVSERLEQALKLRAMLGYKDLFEDKKAPFNFSINNIRVEKCAKHKIGQYDLEVLNYDNLFSPISTSDKFFGTVEILREIELSGEDSTCFQTVVKQVSLPLESAILYEEIKETNIKLEKLEKLKSEFISIVSHELRTPLTAIKNSLDIMLSGKAGEITKIMENFLNMAKRNVTRLSGIINDLLDLSKIEAGKMEFRFAPMCICEPLEFVKSTFDNLAQQKNINVVMDVDCNIPKVYGDIHRIEQVLSNLVSNAIKFTSENGQIKLSAKVVNIDDLDHSKFYVDPSSVNVRVKKLLKGNYIQIDVEDNGIGIKEEDIPKVFDKFQQIESSLSREVGGTGLGLAIAKQLIDAHRGEIWLESEVGKGTVFSFILPVMTQESMFMLEMDNYLQQAKYKHSNLLLLTLEDKDDDSESKSLVDEIVEGKLTVVKYPDKVKTFIQKSGNVQKLNMIVPEIEKDELDYITQQIETFLNNNTECCTENVTMGYAIYPDDAITAEELVEQAKKQSRSLLSQDKDSQDLNTYKLS